MDRMIYLSMSGAKATMQRQDMLANNLANVSTTGFRAELQAFRAVPVRGDGASTRVYALEIDDRLRRDAPARCRPPAATSTWRCRATPGSRCRRSTAPRPTPAPARSTGRADGLLVTRQRPAGAGRRRADQAAAERRRSSIAADGTHQRQVGNGRPQQVGRAQARRRPRRRSTRGDDGLFRAADGDLPADPTARVQDGALEGSQRQPGRDHGGDDRRGAPVRAADEDAADRRAPRAGGHAAAVPRCSARGWHDARCQPAMIPPPA